ncbi:hypothetical protein RFI_20044 [Reticulomyxa filosa]|uniref:Uncharacterized protein n=1 Tax=Reticulomyxa filosa TaxID=46433 RepID=X6MTV9_RETFI|nr:hypothetical protein RFI_20044 [Reticulomyxa filosa]|eukprot:ETO17279.1 hypothetical protein RFI_20044 [Reticulomyxa filosa]
MDIHQATTIAHMIIEQLDTQRIYKVTFEQFATSYLGYQLSCRNLDKLKFTFDSIMQSHNQHLRSLDDKECSSEEEVCGHVDNHEKHESKGDDNKCNFGFFKHRKELSMDDVLAIGQNKEHLIPTSGSSHNGGDSNSPEDKGPNVNSQGFTTGDAKYEKTSAECQNENICLGSELDWSDFLIAYPCWSHLI